MSCLSLMLESVVCCKIDVRMHHSSWVCFHDTVFSDLFVFQFEAEYRRFALKKSSTCGFQEFYRLLQTVHHIPGVEVLLGYADIQGDLLPINNDDNFYKALSSANPLLRIIIQKRGEAASWREGWEGAKSIDIYKRNLIGSLRCWLKLSAIDVDLVAVGVPVFLLQSLLTVVLKWACHSWCLLSALSLVCFLSVSCRSWKGTSRWASRTL